MNTFWTEKTDGSREDSRKPSMLNWKNHLGRQEVASGVTFPALTTPHCFSSAGSFATICTFDPVTKAACFRHVNNSQMKIT